MANESFHTTPFVIRWKGANKFQERAEEKEILAVEKGKMIPSRSRRIALTYYARSESPTFEEPFFISFPDFRDRSRLVTLKCSAYAAMIIGNSGLQTRPVKVSTNRRKLMRFIHATPNTVPLFKKTIHTSHCKRHFSSAPARVSRQADTTLQILYHT